MTQATDVDIRDLKIAIEANSRQISELTIAMRDGFADVNAKFAAVDTKIEAKFAAVDTKIEANSRQISNLTTEMRVGFANVDAKFAAVDTKFATVDTKLAEVRGEITEIRGEVKEVRGDIKALDNKFDERTKSIGQRLDNKEFVIRSTIAAVLSGLLLTFTKFLFFGLTPS